MFQAIDGVIHTANAVEGACNVIVFLEAFICLLFGETYP